MTAARLDKLRAHALHAIRDLTHLPGGTIDDLRQEAMLGLVEALRDHRPDGGASLETFVRLCARRKALTAIKVALREKHRVLTYSDRETLDRCDEQASIVEALPDRSADVAVIAEARATLREIRERIRLELSPLQRRALVGVAVGCSYEELAGGGRDAKSVDNAVQLARLKLRRAA